MTVSRPIWGRRTIAIVIGISALMISLLSLAGPVSKAGATPIRCFPGDLVCFETSEITVIGNVVTLKLTQSGNLANAWAGPPCNVDLNGNGKRGGPMDRAVCALNILRFFGCGQPGWSPRAMICYAATDSSEWRDIRDALRYGRHCLAIQVGSTVDGPWNWTYRTFQLGLNRHCQF